MSAHARPAEEPGASLGDHGDSGTHSRTDRGGACAKSRPQIQAPPPARAPRAEPLGRDSRGNLSFQPLSAYLCPPSVYLLIRLYVSFTYLQALCQALGDPEANPEPCPQRACHVLV